MKVEQGQAAVVTGGASGLGRALAVALASRGVQVTILDLNTSQGEETVRLVQEEHARVSYKPNSQSAIFIRCDVSQSEQLAAAFARHQEVFARLDICINNAGVVSANMFCEGANWRKVIDVNLNAVIDGTSNAIQAMKAQGGLILNVGSAYSFIPAPFEPIYSASKGGVAMFTRSLARIGMGIRVNTICPEYVETPLLSDGPPALVDYIRENVGFSKMERVVAGAFAMLDDESKAGECLWIPTHGRTQIWPDEETKRKYQLIQKDGSVFTGVF